MYFLIKSIYKRKPNLEKEKSILEKKPLNALTLKNLFRKLWM